MRTMLRITLQPQRHIGHDGAEALSVNALLQRLPCDAPARAVIAPVLAVLQSRSFVARVAALQGYEAAHGAGVVGGGCVGVKALAQNTAQHAPHSPQHTP
jgi:hypothetical protein